MFLKTSNNMFFFIPMHLVKSKLGSCSLRDIDNVIDNNSITTSNAKINLNIN